MSKTVKKVGILTAGGLAPCFSASIGYFIETYTRKRPRWRSSAMNGYMGLLQGKSLKVTPAVRQNWRAFVEHGGSPIGNSRVKLTNVKDCVKRGLVKEGQDPQQVAADQLVKDGVDVLHTIGGDDTNTAAADLAAFLRTTIRPDGGRPAQDDRQRRVFRSARASAPGRPRRKARIISPTWWPSTTPTRACSSSTR